MGSTGTTESHDERIPKKAYEAELYRLQAELVKLQEWVRL
jgi:polyphosphate kinase 2 (PPK2 family)